MKNYISWEHLETEREATYKDYICSGLVFLGMLILLGLSILIF